MSQVILPGSTLGILGGGQLGRMFAQAARTLGYRVHVYVPEDPKEDSPAGQVADLEFNADYLDTDALERFARSVDVVTFEFENVPSTTAETLAKHVPVRPCGALLHMAQDRIREKTTLVHLGIPTVSFASVNEESSLAPALAGVGTPSILKTSSSGYDGKGQARINAPEEATAAWNSIGAVPSILEAVADFEREVSIVAARGLDGEVALYEPSDNRHANHILDLSVAPAGLAPATRDQAHEIARTLLNHFEVVGVLCIEFFLMPDGTLLVNEIAPRPHNSGHLTIEASACSQFEQQVRAITGLPLGDPTLRSPAAMANLLGDLWPPSTPRTPNWSAALATGAHLHLYGKTEPRKGRKMGHLTALGATPEEATERALTARTALASS